MYIGIGQVIELILDNGFRHARISCAAKLIPSPGQYLLAGTVSQMDVLPVSLFSTESTLEGFIACAPIPEIWTPGMRLNLRGPLGHGFTLPIFARKIALVAFEGSSARLQMLMRTALKRQAAVVLVCNSSENGLPDEVEVQPLSALGDVLEWAEYTAFDVEREHLSELKEMMMEKNQMSLKGEAQALVRTPLPCGGIAECGICAVYLKSNWRLSCKDGPVFDWTEI